jgi:hypothetical protein
MLRSDLPAPRVFTRSEIVDLMQRAFSEVESAESWSSHRWHELRTAHETIESVAMELGRPRAEKIVSEAASAFVESRKTVELWRMIAQVCKQAIESPSLWPVFPTVFAVVDPTIHSHSEGASQ